MKKKLALLLGALVAAITLTACGTDPKEADYNGKTYQELETEMNQYVSVIGMLHSSVASFMEQNNMKPEDFDYSQMTSEETIESYKSYGVNEQELAAVESWDNIVAQYGELDRTDAESFTINKAGNTTTTDISLYFKNEDGVEKEVIFEIVYKSWNMEVTGVTIEPYKSLSEKMTKAGLNTVISISVVFVVLIVISLIISAFNIFPYLEKRKKEKAQQVSAAPAVETVATTEVVEETDDLELVAVIAAAIAASEGCSTSDFVVRSINRR
ncbi:MAG: OadG family protein [Agathobacter sp.]|uniref:OadG family protein n=1 Tax=Agathobacter sp. TaxID=2021311 RepID=UPI00257FB5D3|nr:OadG family protein [Agathobacter sp.]MBQ1681612.1 OadG family protein [Agathobacter sp.]